MRRAYSLFLYCLLPLVFLRLAWRSLRNKAYLRRIPERFGFVAPSNSKSYIWIHAVSVGEVRAAVPLVHELTAKYPSFRILVTTMTPTGSDQVQTLFGARVDHCYVPYDLYSSVRLFLRRKRPSIIVIMETEIWPNLFDCCRKQGIPIVIANARLSKKSAKGYKRFRRLATQTLNNVTMVGAQSHRDAANLKSIGVPENRIQVTGSIKFEFQLSASLFEAADSLRHQLGNNRTILLAASTREGEDEMILTALVTLKEEFPDLLLVIVPRHPERFTSVYRLCSRAGFNARLRSQFIGMLDADTDILVGDTMGELQLFYAAATVAFVGGSLVNTGGHNILEAAAVGTPIITGPYMYNFAEISEIAVGYGASTIINDTAELAGAIRNYLVNPDLRHDAGEAGKKMVKDNRGALDNTMTMIKESLSVNV